MRRRAGMVFAVVMAAIAVGACATPTPSAPPATAVPTDSAAPSPSPSASPVAVEPTVVCHPNTTIYDANKPIVITLTCENAVAAAKQVVGVDQDVTSIEFAYGSWCWPGSFCDMSLPNTGYVDFHRNGVAPDVRVAVRTDAAGRVKASEPIPMPAG